MLRLKLKSLSLKGSRRKRERAPASEREKGFRVRAADQPSPFESIPPYPYHSMKRPTDARKPSSKVPPGGQ